MIPEVCKSVLKVQTTFEKEEVDNLDCADKGDIEVFLNFIGLTAILSIILYLH